MKKLLTALVATLIVSCLVACTSDNDETQSSSSDIASNSKAMSETTDYPSQISSFKSCDVYGGSVTDEIFRDKRFTVINFWGTYCSPCINEMADLQAWSEEMDEDVQLIGVVIDVTGVDASTNDTAKSIIEKTGVEFTNIIPSGGFANFTASLVGVPTTIIVDSEGERVGDPIVGAQIEEYKKALEKAL